MTLNLTSNVFSEEDILRILEETKPSCLDTEPVDTQSTHWKLAAHLVFNSFGEDLRKKDKETAYRAVTVLYHLFQHIGVGYAATQKGEAAAWITHLSYLANEVGERIPELIHTSDVNTDQKLTLQDLY